MFFKSIMKSWWIFNITPVMTGRSKINFNQVGSTFGNFSFLRRLGVRAPGDAGLWNHQQIDPLWVPTYGSDLHYSPVAGTWWCRQANKGSEAVRSDRHQT